MGRWKESLIVAALFLFLLVGLCNVHHCLAHDVGFNRIITMQVNAALAVGHKIPDTLFGVFFEEINHAGAGGLWAELVSNRGFEAGSIAPWGVVGDNSSVIVSTDRTSCFERNKVALKMDVLCDSNCPGGGVGIFNPGFWGMNIEQGKRYKLILYALSLNAVNINAALTDATGSTVLASAAIMIFSSLNYTRHEIELQAGGTSDTARLQLTANNKATIWFDQVSLMPVDTFKGHGFRNDLTQMLVGLKPAFIRFPGGCFVEGVFLQNSFRWKDTVGPWQERPGHFGDVWNYWTDDGLGSFELLQLTEDLGAAPVWVFNSGNAHKESVDQLHVGPYVQDALDGLEFAKGSATTTWGSLRASMGHPEPFDLRYVGIGNEDCDLPNYKENYIVFYNAIKKAYPDVKLISNCDASSKALSYAADYYDYHIYRNARSMFDLGHKFDKAPRLGPKAFVSEYAVTGPDAKTGTLLAALGEAAFLIGIENNSDLVEMASYAPIFVNVNDKSWNPDAIAFNSSRSYGTPSYYMQQFFVKSNGATLLSSKLGPDSLNFTANAISWNESNTQLLRVKAVNFDNVPVSLTIHLDGIDWRTFGLSATKTELTSWDIMNENSLVEPVKIVPVSTVLKLEVGRDLTVDISANSITSVDFVVGPMF